MNTYPNHKGVKVLSCGAGMQSTALALMSCENSIAQNRGNALPFPLVPIYDAIIFVDLGCEPPWVYNQVSFLKVKCTQFGVPFYVLESNLYQQYMERFGFARTVSIPFWTKDVAGKKGRLRRNCTIDMKILTIQKFVIQGLLGYKPYQRKQEKDIGAHEMHIGFSAEEMRRAFLSKHPFFKNVFPLIEMGLERADNYKYVLERWGYSTKSSACIICPFHTNYFFGHLKCHHTDCYQKVLDFDDMLEERQPNSVIRNQIFISRSTKRIRDLHDSDYGDKQTFLYLEKEIWNGF